MEGVADACGSGRRYQKNNRGEESDMEVIRFRGKVLDSGEWVQDRTSVRRSR